VKFYSLIHGRCEPPVYNYSPNCAASQQHPGLDRAATVTGLVAVGFSFDDEPTVNSKDELTVATSGS
jgi:hypothetical protein